MTLSVDIKKKKQQTNKKKPSISCSNLSCISEESFRIEQPKPCDNNQRNKKNKMKSPKILCMITHLTIKECTLLN